MKSLLLLALTASLLSGPVAAEIANPLPIGQTEIGAIGNTVIRLEGIENSEIHSLRVKLYEAIDQQFRVQALTVLKSTNPAKYNDGKKAEISDAQIKAFYQANDLSKRGPIEELGPQIRAYMEALQQMQHNEKLYEVALASGDIKTALAEPLALLVKVPVDTAYLYGNAKGKVMLLEFSDFQCPYCQRVQAAVNNLQQQYGDRVAFGYRHFPLDFHSDADSSAIASECARDQGKFLEMHNELYKQQRNQSISDVKEMAKKINITDLKTFNACLDSEKYRSRIEKDIAAGKAAGITGTPGFIVGRYNVEKGIVEGEVLSGAMPEAAFKKLLEKYLSSSAATAEVAKR
jgi:protein-disulfide isomerase